MKVNEEQTPSGSQSESPAQVEGLATPRPSDLAIAISQQIDATPDYAAAIDRVIAVSIAVLILAAGIAEGF